MERTARIQVESNCFMNDITKKEKRDRLEGLRHWELGIRQIEKTGMEIHGTAAKTIP